MLKCEIHFAYNHLYTPRMNFAYKFKTKFLWCRPFVDQHWYVHNPYKTYFTFRESFLYILNTNFSCHSFFNFYTKCMQRLPTCCCRNIHFVYINCIHLVKIMYTKCIRDFSVSIDPCCDMFQTLEMQKQHRWWEIISGTYSLATVIFPLSPCYEEFGMVWTIFCYCQYLYRKNNAINVFN